MIGFDPSQIGEWANGEWKPAAPQGGLTGFCNDTRQLKKGDAFVAIRTEQRDGHDFMEAAKAAGASAALVEDFVDDTEIPQLVVGDAVAGVQMIARRYSETCTGKVVGITGSWGKTTVKEFLMH
ncbi:MAG: Mur ligase domain-containing protein, partial [Verrucomicrobiota bacterium]